MSTLASLIRPHVQAELDAASSAEARGQFQTAFRHLERAHVLSQVCTRQHVRVHWRFLRFALRHDRGADAAGQLWRLAGAALLTAVGLVPAGNTGGSNVNGFRRMGVASDLQRVIDDARAASVPPRRRLAVPLATAVATLAALVISGCSTPPESLDLSPDRPSSADVYRVALVPLTASSAR